MKTGLSKVFHFMAVGALALCIGACGAAPASSGGGGSKGDGASNGAAATSTEAGTTAEKRDLDAELNQYKTVDDFDCPWPSVEEQEKLSHGDQMLYAAMNIIALEQGPHSRSELLDILIKRDFPEDVANEALDLMNPDWSEMAVRTLLLAMKQQGITTVKDVKKPNVVDLLINMHGFTQEECDCVISLL